MSSVKTIAKHIVQTSQVPVSNLKLQKLLYYVQGWSLGLHNKPLFTEEIQAWRHGPVVPAAFFHFRHFQWNPIEVSQEKLEIDAADSAHILEVLKEYSKFTASQLETLSHTESPWLEARKNLDPIESSQNVITHESMKSYFGKLAND